ncbi:hypothetical protein PCANC_02639 [Puccinia coronata f. sp. avenae]|uniref:Uncharacterized protein n=1 Tax=Puccinia coronata f. sp. avenae TaxID=200324 RepID=A0A2N5W5I0_9BASI|nr:hypothetical protein PCANC_02639 [Puccinia coronata f. sp. avenae]
MNCRPKKPYHGVDSGWKSSDIPSSPKKPAVNRVPVQSNPPPQKDIDTLKGSVAPQSNSQPLIDVLEPESARKALVFKVKTKDNLIPYGQGPYTDTETRISSQTNTKEADEELMSNDEISFPQFPQSFPDLPGWWKKQDT